MLRKFQLRLYESACCWRKYSAEPAVLCSQRWRRGTLLWHTRVTYMTLVWMQDLQDAAVLILANKQDVKGSMTAAEISQCLTLDTITTHSWHVQACCALTGEGWVLTHLTLSLFPSAVITCVCESTPQRKRNSWQGNIFIDVVSFQFTCQSGLDEVQGCCQLEHSSSGSSFLKKENRATLEGNSVRIFTVLWGKVLWT